jgi:spore germination protein (amino acid permease)
VPMKEKLSPVQVSILIYMIQSGVVLFSLPRLTGEAFGTNGWIGLFIVYSIVNLNLVLIWLVFKVGNGRSFSELLELIPKWLAVPLVLFLALQWTTLGTMVMVNFVFLLRMMFYHYVSKLLLMAMGLGLSYVLVKKSIQSIARATTVLFYFTVWTVFLLAFHLQDFSFTRLTPFIFQGEKDLIKGGLAVYTSLLGYELSILFLHKVENKKLRAVIVGNTITSLIYLGVCLVSYGFFSFEMMIKDMYPVVTLLKYISFPVLERVENFIFSLFGLKVLITTVMYLWGAKEVVEQQFKGIPRKYILLTIFVFSSMVSLVPKISRQANLLLEYLAYVETAIAFIFPTFLLIIAYFSKKIKEGKSL